jgi:hypothetical protein
MLDSHDSLALVVSFNDMRLDIQIICKRLPLHS